MATQTPQPRKQTFICIATNSNPPIDNFEQWARRVRFQMLTSLHRKTKHSPNQPYDL